MDIATLAAAYESTKTLLGLAKGAASAVADYQIKDKLIDIQQGILDLQAKLGDAQAERLDLLQQLAQLREQLRVAEGVKANLDSYVLHETEPGVFLYRAKPEDGHTLEHYACPRCYSGGRVAILQSGPWDDGMIRWRCSVCTFMALTGAPT